MTMSRDRGKLLTGMRRLALCASKRLSLTYYSPGHYYYYSLMPQYRVRGLDGREYGPVELDKLILWVREGRIVSRMMLERDGCGSWVPASSVPELAAAFGSPTVPPAPNVSHGADPMENYGPGGLQASRPAMGPPARNPNPNLSVGYCYGKAWDLIDFQFILQVLVAFFLSHFIPIIIYGPLLVGVYRCALKRVDGLPVEFSEVFSGFDQFVDALVGFLLFTAAGFLMCCPPIGLFVMTKIWLWPNYIADRPGRAGFDAVSDAWTGTDGRFFDILLLGLVGFGVWVLGLLCCFVGIFVAMPFIALAAAVAYREMVPKNSAAAAAAFA